MPWGTRRCSTRSTRRSPCGRSFPPRNGAFHCPRVHVHGAQHVPHRQPLDNRSCAGQPCWTAVLDTNCAEAFGRRGHWPLLSPRCFPRAVRCPRAHGARPCSTRRSPGGRCLPRAGWGLSLSSRARARHPTRSTSSSDHVPPRHPSGVARPSLPGYQRRTPAALPPSPRPPGRRRRRRCPTPGRRRLRCAAGSLLDAASYGSAGFIPATATA